MAELRRRLAERYGTGGAARMEADIDAALRVLPEKYGLARQTELLRAVLLECCRSSEIG